MIKYYCDCCGKGTDNENAMSRLEIAEILCFEIDVYRDEAHLCAECTKRALNPVLEVGKKYRARDQHGNIVDVTIAEMTNIN